MMAPTAQLAKDDKGAAPEWSRPEAARWEGAAEGVAEGAESLAAWQHPAKQLFRPRLGEASRRTRGCEAKRP